MTPRLVSFTRLAWISLRPAICCFDTRGICNPTVVCLSQRIIRSLFNLLLAWISYHLCMALRQLKARKTADINWIEALVSVLLYKHLCLFT